MCTSDDIKVSLNPSSQQRKRRRPSILWLLACPLIGGILTHCWDLVLLSKYSRNNYDSDIVYDAEVAPHLKLRQTHPKKSRPSVSSDVEGRNVASKDSRQKVEGEPQLKLTDDFDAQKSNIKADEVTSHLKRQKHERKNHLQIVSLDPGVTLVNAPQTILSKASQMKKLKPQWSDSVMERMNTPTDEVTDQQPNNEADDDCIPMHSWQTSFHPMCNPLHEVDFHSKFRRGALEYIDSGGFNDLFHLMEPSIDIGMDSYDNVTEDSQRVTELAIKILSFHKDYTDSNYQIVRLDAVVQERLMASPNIFDIHGYCGFALVLPYVTGGTISSHLRKWHYDEIELSPKQRLQYAVDMARGLRDLHNIDGDGVPSVVHGDLKEQQYLITQNGRLQLGDFNKGTLLKKSKTTGEACAYRVAYGANDKVYRSPEEYAYQPQTAATDVWALGSLMFYLLTGSRVWRDISETHTDLVRRYIMDGKKPPIRKEILKSKEPVDVALRLAYEKACQYYPEKRATAREVSDFLEKVWEHLYKEKI